MATLQHNITGESTVALLSAGDNARFSKISLANVHGSLACYVDLFIEKQNVGRYYLFKQLELPADVSLIYDASFNSSVDGFNLFIKLTKSASETPAVDVVLL